MDNTLGVIDVAICDNDGREFTAMGEHELVLSIESTPLDDFDQKQMLQELREIRRTLRDLLMYKVLKVPR
jgi:hypothetical protein